MMRPDVSLFRFEINSILFEFDFYLKFFYTDCDFKTNIGYDALFKYTFYNFLMDLITLHNISKH